LQYILGTGIYVEGISNPDVKCCGPETDAVALQCDLLFTSDFIETYFHLHPFEGKKLHFNPVRPKLIYGMCMRPEFIPHETHIFFIGKTSLWLIIVRIMDCGKISKLVLILEV